MSAPDLSPRERTWLGRLAAGLRALWRQFEAAWRGFAHSSQNAWWFPVLLATLVAVDSFLVILPSDVFVGLAVVSNPRRWKRIAVVSALGSTLGSFALYVLIRHFGRNVVDHLDAGGFGATHWRSAARFFAHWGLFSLALGSVIPGGSWPPVVLAGLYSDRWVAVFGWLVVGRLARFWTLAFSSREGWAIYQVMRQEARQPPPGGG